MAVVTFTSSMPQGLRLEELFTSVVGESLVDRMESGHYIASFKIIIYQDPVDVFYEGSTVSEAGKSIAYLRFGPQRTPWWLYREVNVLVQSIFSGLTSSPAKGPAAEPAVMKG